MFSRRVRGKSESSSLITKSISLDSKPGHDKQGQNPPAQHHGCYLHLLACLPRWAPFDEPHLSQASSIALTIYGRIPHIEKAKPNSPELDLGAAHVHPAMPRISEEIGLWNTLLKRVGYPWNGSGTCTYRSKKKFYLTYRAPRVRS